MSRLKAHFRKHFVGYKPGSIFVYAVLSMVMTIAPLYSHFSYVPTESKDLIVQEVTYKDMTQKGGRKNKYYALETFELCSDLTLNNIRIFQKDKFFKDVTIGEKIIIKIKNSDYGRLDECKDVKLFSLQQGYQTYVSEFNVFEYEQNNRGFWAPLLGVFFFFCTVYMFLGIIYMKRVKSY